ncbi:MAG TPA: DUF6152 family protein [Steroidobacteraceae bacterium]|nr:DUF6152 family protein [Steroidobacteraceae bacterium]
MRRRLLLWLLISGASAGAAFAHHSFAVFFETDRTISVDGVVTEFRFSNPHGLVRLNVTAKDGSIEVWTAETNSPSILVRRGWTRDSLKPGEHVTVQGWPARSGARYLRMLKVIRENGQVIGKPFDPNQE